MPSDIVLVSARKGTPIGCADLQPLFRKVDLALAAARALCTEIVIGTIAGIVSRIANRKVLRRYGGSTQHTANSRTCVHRANAVNQWGVRKILNPNLGEALVVGSERGEELSADDGEMGSRKNVCLKVVHCFENVIPLISAIRIGHEGIKNCCPAFDENVVSKRRGDHGINAGFVIGLATICAGEEANTAGD